MIDKTLNRILRGKRRVTFTVENREGYEVKVVLEGDGRCCKDIRDRIVLWSPNSNWVQGSLVREKMEG